MEDEFAKVPEEWPANVDDMPPGDSGIDLHLPVQQQQIQAASIFNTSEVCNSSFPLHPQSTLGLEVPMSVDFDFTGLEDFTSEWDITSLPGDELTAFKAVGHPQIPAMTDRGEIP